MTLLLRFWGVRGSIPSPGPRTAQYGGNTPCVEVRTKSGGLVILDAGTGLRELGRSLVAQEGGTAVIADIFLTHAHWDHIQGIPFFAPLFERGNRFTIWSSKVLAVAGGAEQVVRDQMGPVVFPVSFDELKAQVDFREIAEEQRIGNGYVVTAFPVQHPGGAVGYRFADAATGESFVYISDNELASTGGHGTGANWRAGLVEFVRGSQLLIHDATYTNDEYQGRRGWGHSTYDEAVALALDAGVDELVLFHHNPERSDDELGHHVAACQAMVRALGNPLRVRAAAEGMTLRV